MKKRSVYLAALAAIAGGLAAAAGLSEHAAGFAQAGSLQPPDALGLGLAVLVGDVVSASVAEINAELKRISDEVKSWGEKALGQIKDQGKVSAETKAEVDQLLAKQGELRANLQSVEQLVAKLEANGAGGDVQRVSLGRQFVESDNYKAFSSQARPRGRVDLEVKAAITSLDVGTDGSAGALTVPTRLPGILEIPQRRFTVRDLISPGRMDGDLLEYVRETGFTNNAGMVAEGTRKPESSLKFDKVITTAKVVAHFMKASRQILSDASQLASIIDQRLRYGLEFKEEDELLNGDGTGQNLLGIIPQATAYLAPFDPVGTETSIDVIRLALLQSELADFPATGTVMNPIDWARIELLKDSTGQYIIGNPQGTIGATLWSRPVVTTKAITADKFLSGAFRLGAQVFDRWLARVEVATENEDDFVNNLVTVLCEERLALAVYRPEAFIYGDLGNLP